MKVGTSLLMYSIFCGIQFTKFLLEKGANINATDKVINIYIMIIKIN